ncbi:NADPH-dependent 7-cyano-7-deazaguanine reductase QueF [Allopusillimonas ginsengisoli]|uniref:NADPH-dependent 7-cyano-7-deazaguanine reductase QueF n=1 Tax=Allopusillimonas ginsengisoli TaxID=453575 RepID=UPI001021D83C|nr:NADPH-dependent 7-cyano-7-deazaguanine reductase QueF [Allopusillimonas ginsengisoli]TEA77371.1 NADPH-dependent 7-cyano-7-deazaguanine reductase QueF [Allopusillimonas ginsengisoli]
MQTPLSHAPLGRDVVYPSAYDASLLFPVARAINRQALNLPAVWHGADIWNAYELSWLTPKGKPVVAIGRFTFPWTSPNLVESKSFKLYLNAFSEERFDNTSALARIMARDLSAAAGASVQVELQPLCGTDTLLCRPLEGINIDGADIEISQYEPQPDLLHCAPGNDLVTETLVSDLLKSNCPVTGQPDWGSVQIRYTGPRIDREALLRYVVSLRRHTEFHEHCVEKMYCDILAACKPQALLVHARYTRRGGLDINPWRSSLPHGPQEIRTLRQ